MYNDPLSPFPHSMDPQLRKLGLATSMVRGVPSLTAPHVICKKGKTLTAEQAQLLKLIGEQMAYVPVLDLEEKMTRCLRLRCSMLSGVTSRLYASSFVTRR